MTHKVWFYRFFFILLLLLSILVIIFPGLPEGVESAGEILLLVALFSFIHLLYKRSTRAFLPAFISGDDSGKRHENSGEFSDPQQDFIRRTGERLAAAIRAENWQAAAFYLPVAEDGTFDLIVEQCDDSIILQRKVPGDHVLFGDVFFSGQGRVLEISEKKEQLYRSVMAEGPATGRVSLEPVPYEHGSMGLLLAVGTQGGQPGGSDEQLVSLSENIADLAHLIERIHDLERENSRERDFRLFSLEMNEIEDREAVLPLLEKECRQQFGYRTLMFGRILPESPRRLHWIHISGEEASLKEGDSYSLQEEWLRKCMNSRGLLLPDLRAELGDRDPFSFLEKGDPVMFMPLHNGGKAWGLLLISGHKSLEYTKKELEVLHDIGVNFASASHRLWLSERVGAADTLDPLTGIMNGRRFRERLFEEMNRAKRYGYAFACLSLDIDKFRQIKEIHGQEFVDHVLRESSRLLSDSIRNVDAAARTEEGTFMVLLPGIGDMAVQNTAMRIRSTLESARYEYGSVKETLRFRLLVGSYPGSGEEIEEFLSGMHPL